MISATAAAGAAPVFRPHRRARRGGGPVLQNPEAATAPYAVETSRATHVSYNCGHGHVWRFFYRPPNQAAHARWDWHRNKRFAVTRSYIAFLKQKRKKILPFSISGTACRSFPKRLRIKRPNAYGLWHGARPIRHGRREFWSVPKSRGCVCVWLRKVDKCVS